MVAALLSLRFRVLANTLRRNTLQLLAVIFGAVQTLVILVVVFSGLTVLVLYPQPVQQATVVIGGVALTVGWFLVPLIATGIEPTVDPLKLAAFPLSVSRLMAAMTLIGATWIPGIATLLVSFATALTWRQTPGAAWAAVGCGVVATLICIVGSRMTAALSANMVAGPRRDRMVVVLIALVVLFGPVALALGLGLGSDQPFPATAEVLGFTPFGAIWSVPGQLVVGHWAAALGSLAIGLVTLVLMLVIWRAALLATFRYRGGGAGGRRQSASGRLGALGAVPATPAGAIGARSLIYWARDARFARQLVLVPLMPALLILLASLVHTEWLVYLAPPIVAGLLPLTLFAVISYDGTAFALQLSSGVRGVDDRIGRALALLAFALPAVVIVSVVSLGVIGAWRDLPAVFGIALGVLLSGLAAVSVSSASIVVPVARSGRNPFTAQPGSGMTSLAASYAVSGVTIALAVPELALGIAGLLVHSAMFGWLALALGVLWGAGALVIAVRLGGRILDRTGPALLARMRRTGG